MVYAMHRTKIHHEDLYTLAAFQLASVIHDDEFTFVDIRSTQSIICAVEKKMKTALEKITKVDRQKITLESMVHYAERCVNSVNEFLIHANTYKRTLVSHNINFLSIYVIKNHYQK